MPSTNDTKNMTHLDLIDEMRPSLIMLQFTESRYNQYKYLAARNISDNKIIFSSNNGWNIRFFIGSNFVELINREYDFKKRLPLGKNTLNLLIKIMTDKDNEP